MGMGPSRGTSDDHANIADVEVLLRRVHRQKTEPVDAVSPNLGNVLLFDSWNRPFERADNGEDKSDC
jgi:hypothetical protein